MTAIADLFGRALAAHNAGNLAEAVKLYRTVLAVKPRHVKVLNGLAKALLQLGNHDEGIILLQRSLEGAPDQPEVLHALSAALRDLQRLPEALACADRAIALAPAFAEAWFTRGVVLQGLQRVEEAIASFDGALALQPGMPHALCNVLNAQMYACQWENSDRVAAQLVEQVEAGALVTNPFSLLALPVAPPLLQQCAEAFGREAFPPRSLVSPRPARPPGDKLRIGYFSADFRSHEVARLIAGVIERHDRSRFEVIGFALGPPAEDPARARLRAAFDQFIPADGRSDADLAGLAREMEIDIAIDLGGYTLNCGLGILAFRPAPVQLHYLGLPATLGLPYIDYLVADPVVIPAEQRPYYSEKIITLPDSYLTGDPSLRIADRVFTRGECGLPEEGVVYCCFNNSYKITPDLFAIWMRLLERVAGSVLWLAATNPLAEENLRRAAAGHGVAPERLVFAGRLDTLEEHLARHRLADLFLDTFYANAQAAANHALWAGLPVLTCAGETFASRVGASLLTAVGLPELITHSHREYEALALDLATDPGKLHELRTRLAANRQNGPLFDTARFVGHLEEAYTQVWGRHRAGLSPEDIRVARSPRSGVAPEPSAPPPEFPPRAVAAQRSDTLAAVAKLYQAILAGEAGNPLAINHLGGVLEGLKGLPEVLAAIDRAVVLRPDFADAWFNRGLVLFALNNPVAAIASFDWVIALAPDYAEGHYHRGNVLQALERWNEAAASYERVVALEPGKFDAEAQAQHCRMMICNWDDFCRRANNLMGQINMGELVTTPFPILSLEASPALLRHCAETCSRARFPKQPLPEWATSLTGAASPLRKKIRLGYFFADCYNHPVALLTTGIFERHDRSRFEVIGFSTSPIPDDALHRRLIASFDRFVPLSRQPNAAARHVHDLEIDIVIDLGGYAPNSGLGIFTYRPAPVQLHYLGYPGTLGHPCIDYLVADPVVIPEEQRRHYAEKLISLPDSYLVGDSRLHIADREFTRAEFGLPPEGFVYCCFNKSSKITPDLFTIWMRLLEQVAGSVLWLAATSPQTVENLRREAAVRGVAPARLVFAGRLEQLAEHLSRHRLADLYLDTFYANARSAVTHALWAGLPVLTCPGETFASRVGASQLTAVGLPELVAGSHREYEALALDLATDPGKLRAIKDRLAANRLHSPLFDTTRFVHHLEEGYARIWERYQAGLPPADVLIR